MNNELKELQKKIDQLRENQLVKERQIEKLAAQAQSLAGRIKEVLLDAYELNYRSKNFNELEREIYNISTSDMIVEEKELRLNAISSIISAKEYQNYIHELFEQKKQS